MKKIVIILVLIAMVSISMTACGKEEHTANYKEGHSANYDNALLATHYNALEELAYDAELIIEAELTGKSKEIPFRSTRYKLTEVNVNKVMKGNIELKSNVIQLLEIASLSMDPHKNNILFLDKYEGPVANDAYVVVGLYQGRFKINDDNLVVYDADKNNGVKHFQASVEGLDTRTFEQQIQEAIKNARPPKPNLPQLSEAEQKLAEEESHKIYLEDRKRIEEEEKQKENSNK
ncbi:hypothetical protein [Paenibacillus agilis]|uniref:Lipoprotein n=1 Tax=Paenibacillus agilis TaxID=3020863 RepID=A0A559J2K2_9BACL|nr:hypothetical protein [Paenibacillus agilis]TVX94119.1 hypothetical protein FPZ44_14300 [Paenibacillus agilis]